MIWNSDLWTGRHRLTSKHKLKYEHTILARFPSNEKIITLQWHESLLNNVCGII